MSLLKSALALPIAALLCLPAFAQTGTLTDAQVNAAIQRGMTTRWQSSWMGPKTWSGDGPSKIGQHQVWRPQTFMDGKVVSINSDIDISVYTAEDYIASKAATAHHNMMPFSVSDVTPEMRTVRLTVVADTNITFAYDDIHKDDLDTVDNVVLQVGGAVIQPTSVVVTHHPGMTRKEETVQLQGEIAEFPMEAVSGKGDFVLTVIMNHERHDFKIKAVGK